VRRVVVEPPPREARAHGLEPKRSCVLCLLVVHDCGAAALIGARSSFDLNCFGARCFFGFNVSTVVVFVRCAL